MRSVRALALSLCLLPACKDEAGSPATDDGAEGPGDTGTEGGSAGSDSTTNAVDPNAPTYYEDVRPLVAKHCAACHVEGGIAPFDVMAYEAAKAVAPVMASAAEARTMPPFNADNSGMCHTFQDARWLAEEEIALLREWADAGAPEGDPSTPAPEIPAPEALAGADIRSYSTPVDYVPVPDDAGPIDDYQCFLLDPEIADVPRYLVGFEVVPGNLAITHHLVGFQVDKTAMSPLGGTNEEWMQQLDELSPEQPGWECFGAAGDNILPEGTPLTWAPGGAASNFPEGTGIRFDPGDVIVVQMHYNLANGEGTDQTEVRLSWADEVEREAVNVLNDEFLRTAFSSPVTIPAGEEAWVWQWEERLGNWSIAGAAPPFDAWGQVQILGLLPHMHQLGQRMQVTFIDADDASEQCGIYVDRWDFHWQQGFEYEQPIVLDALDTIRIACEWDTSHLENDVYPGLGTANEMCLLGIYAAQVP